jgi:uncharacterized protein (TIGR00304 family)
MSDLVVLGAVAIIAGIFTIVLGTLFFGSRSSRDGSEEKDDEKDDKRRTEVRGGGVILIGPIPIIFGTDIRWTIVAIVLALVLVTLSLFLTRIW